MKANNQIESKQNWIMNWIDSWQVRIHELFFGISYGSSGLSILINQPEKSVIIIYYIRALNKRENIDMLRSTSKIQIHK